MCVGYMPPPLIFNTSNEVICRLPQWYRLSVPVGFLGLVPPVSHGRPTVYPASEYRPCMWYATSANPDMLLVACGEFSQPLQPCPVQIHTNNRHLSMEQRSMREGSHNAKDNKSAGNIQLSSRRTTCMGRVRGAALSDSIRFTRNFGSCRLICSFVFTWWILTLFSSIPTCFPSG